jgi:acyl-CoA synthetase (AMP-forming)/AMP-acid ligase II
MDIIETKYLTDFLFRNAAKLKHKEFLVCRDRSVSWAEARDESEIVSSFIADKLAGRQQKVIGILLPDSWQFVVAYFGVTGSGNIAMPIDMSFKKLEINSITEAIKPALVIASQETRHLSDETAFLIEDILTDKNPPVDFNYQLPPDKQIATLFFSSGTTGQPKAIPNTHANQLWDVAAIAGPMGWTSADSLLITLHLAHRHGLVICLMGAVYHGNTVYLEERFNASRTLEMLQSGKVSLYSSVPSAYEKLVECEPQTAFDLSAVRLLASSSSPLPPYLQQAFRTRFNRDILDRYGTSETGSIAIKTASHHDTFGEPLEGVKLKVGRNGEVALKSPGLFPGYFKNQAATKKNMTKDGWWLTGDIGELRDGKLILKGRTKERITKSGYSIYPQDIEWALAQNPNVREVKIISLPNSKKLDDKVIAFVAGDITEPELELYSKTDLPRSWRPDAFIKIDSIPKTPNGKPKLSALKEMASSSL